MLELSEYAELVPMATDGPIKYFVKSAIMSQGKLGYHSYVMLRQSFKNQVERVIVKLKQ